jgi:hypothetical protein
LSNRMVAPTPGNGHDGQMGLSARISMTSRQISAGRKEKLRWVVCFFRVTPGINLGGKKAADEKADDRARTAGINRRDAGHAVPYRVKFTLSFYGQYR